MIKIGVISDKIVTSELCHIALLLRLDSCKIHKLTDLSYNAFTGTLLHVSCLRVYGTHRDLLNWSIMEDNTYYQDWMAFIFGGSGQAPVARINGLSHNTVVRPYSSWSRAPNQSYIIRVQNFSDLPLLVYSSQNALIQTCVIRDTLHCLWFCHH